MRTWEPDDHAAEDVVGTASARLLAAGVPRADRLGALRLLGLLSDGAGVDRTVRRSLPDLCGEFDLRLEDGERWLDALVDVGIVHRRLDTLVLAGVEPPPTGGLRLADFLANAELADASRHRRHRRPVFASAGAVAAAAAVVALVAVPLLGRGPAPRSADPLASGRAPTVATEPSQPSSVPPAQEEPVSTGATVTSPSTTPSTAAMATAVCPQDEPIVEVLGIVRGADGITVVDGLARNDSASAVEIDVISVTVRAEDEVVAIAHLDQVLMVRAGDAVAWTLQVPVPALPTLHASAAADTWRWAEPAAREACG